MKKNEIYVIAAIIVLSVLGIIGTNLYRSAMKNKPDNMTSVGEPSDKPSFHSGSIAKPSEQPIGIWVGIVHRDVVVQWFDSGVNAEYTVKGDVGEMHVEVVDGKWHVREVECPNQVCVKMGWADQESIIPITCLPNNIYIGTADLLEEYLGV